MSSCRATNGKRTYWMAHARTVLEFHPWLFACSAPPARARDPEPVPEVALAPGFGPRAARADDIVKQMGSAPVGLELRAKKGDDPAEWPADLRVQEFPQ